FWHSLARTGLRDPEHEIYVSDDGASVAIWRGIDKWKLPPRDIARTLPALVSPPPPAPADSPSAAGCHGKGTPDRTALLPRVPRHQARPSGQGRRFGGDVAHARPVRQRGHVCLSGELQSPQHPLPRAPRVRRAKTDPGSQRWAGLDGDVAPTSDLSNSDAPQSAVN